MQLASRHEGDLVPSSNLNAVNPNPNLNLILPKCINIHRNKVYDPQAEHERMTLDEFDHLLMQERRELMFTLTSGQNQGFRGSSLDMTLPLVASTCVISLRY